MSWLILTILGRLSRYAKNGKGNIALMFGLMAPVILACVGAGIDLATLSSKKATLQAAADSAALVGAKQLAISSVTDSAINAQISGFLSNQLAKANAAATNTATIDHTNQKVTVKVQELWTPVFAHYLMAGVTPVVVQATAQLQSSGSSASSTSICVLTLDPASPNAILVKDFGQMSAPKCGIYSNSKNIASLTIMGSGKVNAKAICSVGGVSSATSATNIAPVTDCAPTPDPLSAIAAPTVKSTCDFTNMNITSGIWTLTPGVYCGGISISKLSIVKFAPGDYVIKDGPLRMADVSAITGKDVAFYLTGDTSVLQFSDLTAVAMQGRLTGPMAGMLFFADRAQTLGTLHTISSIAVLDLTGTIYLPTSELRVDAPGQIAGNSAYTAIVANRITVANLANLILNNNYSATSVPVPGNIKSNPTVTLTN